MRRIELKGLYRHKKTGRMYRLEHIAISDHDDTTELAIYRGVNTSGCWARELNKFLLDFEKIA